MTNNSKKFVALEMSRPFLRLLRVYREQDDHILRILSIFLFFDTLFASWLYIWFCADYNFDLSIVSTMFSVMSGAVQVVLAYLSLVIQVELLTETISLIQEAVDKRCEQSEEAYSIYKKCEERHSRIANGIYRFAMISVFLLCGIVALLPIIYAIFGTPAPNQWIIPMPMHTLLNIDTYFGFYLNWFIETNEIIFFYGILTSIPSLFIGFCIYMKTMKHELGVKLIRDPKDLLINKQGNSVRNLSKSDAWQICINSFEFYEEMLNIADKVEEIMSSVLFYQLFSCVLFLAFGIFALDSTLDELSFSTFLCILILLNALIPTFVYCYFADTYSTDLLDVGDVFYNSFWYILPVKQQILMIIPIQRAQLPFILTGFGIVYCTLVTYASLVKTAVSYFLAMRELR